MTQRQTPRIWRSGAERELARAYDSGTASLLHGVRNVATAFQALANRPGSPTASSSADRAIHNQRNLEHIYRRAMSALIDVEDVREVTAKRELYRRLVRTSDHLAAVAERVWYAVLKGS
jgi:hypothetical protein